jgi:hypothetical protein
MSLLHHESPEEMDDAARGEAFTKGSSHVALASVAATVLVAFFVAVYVLAGQKPPVAGGVVVQVWVHPNHVVTSGIDANGEPMAKVSFDQVLVFAHLKFWNQSKVPLVLEDVLANIRQADGILSVTAGSVGQYDEVFLAYPELAALHSKAFPPHAIIAPGQSLEGNAFWVFRMSKKEWDAHQAMNFSFKLQYQSSLVLAPHTPVIEQ